jgi:hypothetical protein
MKPEVTSQYTTQLDVGTDLEPREFSAPLYNVLFKNRFNIILPSAPSTWCISIRSGRSPHEGNYYIITFEGTKILDICDLMGQIKHSRKSKAIFKVKRLFV